MIANLYCYICITIYIGAIVGVLTLTSQRITGIIRTWIAIIAVFGRSYTASILADVILSTQITIITVRSVVGVLTLTSYRITGIISAWIAIITVFGRSLTAPILANIILSTRITVIT